MPHIPQNFRPLGKLAPSNPDLASGLPKDMPAASKPPIPRREYQGRKGRRVRIKESLSMSDWDVAPARILQDLFGVSQW